MLYSYNIEDEKAVIFSMFLENLSNGNNSYKDEVVRVLRDVKALSLETKNLFSIDRSYFRIILHLFETNPEFYKGIDLDNLESADYKMIEDSLHKSNDFIYAR